MRLLLTLVLCLLTLPAYAQPVKLLSAAGGWYPRVSPDGRYVLAGFGNVAVYDVQTGAKHALGPGFVGGWNSATEFVIILNGVVKVGTVGSWTLRDIHSGKGLNDFAADGGHWCGVHRAGSFPAFFDGTQIATDALGCDVWRDTVVISVNRKTVPAGRNDWQNYHLLFFKNGVLQKEIPPPYAGIDHWRLRHGYLGAGYFGRARLIDPSGKVVDVTAVPSGGGESPPLVELVNGQPWVVTGAEYGGQAMTLVRPLGAKDVIRLPFASVRPDMRAVGSDLIVAGNAAGGGSTMHVYRVPTSLPRSPIAPVATPEPMPEPKPEPPPTAEHPTLDLKDAIDLSSVTFLHTDVSKWRITSNLHTVKLPTGDGYGLELKHTMAGKWPVKVIDGTETEGNPWVVANIGGRWYAATYEWLRPGQTVKLISRTNLGDHTKKAPLETWDPKPGEAVGFFVSCLARDKNRNCEERTQVVLTHWPGDSPRPVPEPCPDPPKCPTCPPDQSDRIARLEQELADTRAARDEAQQAHLNALEVIKALEARRCEAKVFGIIPVPCRIVP